MLKVVVVVILVVTLCEGGSDSNQISDKVTSNNRQKRLLFFDEDGSLVKTYPRPYFNDLSELPNRIPFFGKFFNPFLAFLRPTTLGAMTYMVPVSDEVIQQVNRDPVFQNKIMLSPARDPQIEFNPSCAGRRTQNPSSKSCGSFLNCWDGWAFEQECPAGLVFSLEGYCDYEHNVNCNERRASDESGPTCNKEFEAFRNEVNCNEFFICINRSPIRFKCPADLAYSQVLGVCDYPYRVECNASLAVSTDAPSPPAADPVSSSSSAPQTMSNPPAILDPVAKTVMTHSVFNSQSLSTTHVAMSRQDAIRQLRLANIADVTSA